MVDALTPHLPNLLWWVPLLPLIAGGIIAFLPDSRGRIASKLAIGALFVSCVISLVALACSLAPKETVEGFAPITWFTFGDVALKVGLLLDPLSAGMAAMVTFVAFWIFIYSTGYMADEKRYGRFFGFLSLLCGAMLMVVLSNSLLLLFMAWELVGLASYLLIGFYFEKPSAAAAAQKAFITTRVGDMAFFLDMIWLYSQSGTLLFYDTELAGGTLQTLLFCIEEQRPFRLIDCSLVDSADAVEAVRKFTQTYEIRILNVAGPRQSGSANIYGCVRQVMKDVIRFVK